MLLNLRGRGIGSVAVAALLWCHAPAAADVIETAKPADTISPYGVSYHTGSFTYRLPLLEIGYGEWPDRLTVVLQHDSSGNRHPNTAWSLNQGSRLSQTMLVEGLDPYGSPDESQHLYNFSVISGNTAVSFEKTGEDRASGEYYPGTNEGHSLTYEALPGSWPYTPGGPQEGHFIFTSRDGHVFRRYMDRYNNPGAGEHNLANGSSVIRNGGLYPSSGGTLETNRGLFILVEPKSYGTSTDTQKVCTYNLAFTDRATIQDCSQSTQVATLTYAHLTNRLLSAQLPNGQTYNFEYVAITDIAGPSEHDGWLMPPRTRNHLSCIREPGQSTCLVRNEYDACDGPGAQFEDEDWTGSRDRVIRQTLGDGRVITYTYSPTHLPCRGIGSVAMSEGGATTTLTGDGINFQLLQDPLTRQTQYQWTGGNSQTGLLIRDGLLQSVTLPGDESVHYTYDGRGNLTEIRRKARPNIGLPDLVESAVYPASCTNVRTCNRPLSRTDARLNTTNYEYDSAHGGLTRETGPPDGNGIRPARRYHYAQRYAWRKSGSGYVQADTPIWLLTSERFCRTTATVGDGCAGGTQDEVVTTYDYGPVSGPNNLWLRGQAVTATDDGITTSLRTCYGYDALGRRISETQPNANLATCP